MPPLNACDIRDQRYAKPWCLWTPLARVKTVVKVIDMFDLAFGRDQMYGKFIRSLIPPFTWVKGGVKVKITFALFFVMDQMTFLTHIWRTLKFGSKLWSYLTSTLIRIKFRVNPIFRAMCGPQMIPLENEEWYGVCSLGFIFFNLNRNKSWLMIFSI